MRASSSAKNHQAPPMCRRPEAEPPYFRMFITDSTWFESHWYGNQPVKAVRPGLRRFRAKASAALIAAGRALVRTVTTRTASHNHGDTLVSAIAGPDGEKARS